MVIRAANTDEICSDELLAANKYPFANEVYHGILTNVPEITDDCSRSENASIVTAA